VSKGVFEVWHRFTRELQQTVFAAVARAKERGAGTVSLADFFVAMLAIKDSHGARILCSSVSSFQLQNGGSTGPDLKLAPDASDVFRRATDEAIGTGDNRIGSEHVLLAALRESRLVASLNCAPISYAQARAAVRDFQRHGWDAPQPSLLGRPFRHVSGLLKGARRKLLLARKVYLQHSIANPRFISDPYPLYARLRAEGLRRDPLMQFWIGTRYEDVVAVLRDPRFVRDVNKFIPDELSRERLPAPIRKELCPIPENLSQAMLLQDPPKHTRLRALVNAAFTPRSITDMHGRIQQIADELLDSVASRGEMDLIADFANPLPTIVISEMLGVPTQDRDKLKLWSDDVAGLLTTTSTLAEDVRGAAAMSSIHDFFSAIVAKRRSRPDGSLLSAMVTAEAAGDKLSEMELYSNAVLLLAAGHETTTNLIGNGLFALLQHPQQLRKLRDDPSLMPTAIEELLRFDSPAQWTGRTANEDVDLNGTRIKRGEMIIVGLGSANRDPKYFTDPDRLDITRVENRHLSFGAGIHFCLGAALARMEGAIAIGTLLRRFPNLHLPRQKIVRRKSRPLRGLAALRVRW
jgi:cytochrome P450